jgi:hypothetical protein
MAIGVILTSCFLQTIQVWIFRKPKTVINLVLFAYLISNFLFLGIINIFQILLSYGSIPAIILLSFMRLCAKCLDAAATKSIQQS